MYYPEELVEEVRFRNDIVSVISQHVRLTKKGGGYFACCPFHNEKTPSFHVNPSRQTYHCFGCGEGGNVITFLMKYENLSFQEALKQLADRAGIALPQQEVSAEEKEQASLKSRLLAANKEAAIYFVHQLRTPQGARAKEYFLRRGLSEDTIRAFGLGYAQNYRDDLYRYLKGKGFSDGDLAQTGLIRLSEKGVRELFWNRAMFPIMDAASRVIGFGGRVMGEGEPKYLNSPETPLFDKSRNLYGMHLARKSRRNYFLLCEGYMDVIAMHQAGFDSAVASLGTALTAGHAMLMKRYNKDAILAYDSDEAGIKAAVRAIPLLRDAGIATRVLNLKPYKDPDEFLVKEGAEAFEERLREAADSFLFESDVAAARYDMDNPQEKTAFHRELARLLLSFPEELERNNYLEAVCRRHEIPADALRELVRKLSLGMPEGGGSPRFGGQRETERRQKPRNGGLVSAEQLVLSWALSESGRPDRLLSYLKASDFSDSLCRALAEELFPEWEAGRRPLAASLLNRAAEREESGNGIAALLSVELPEGSEEEREMILAKSIRRIRRESLDRLLRSGPDGKKMQEIVEEKAALERMPIHLLD